MPQTTYKDGFDIKLPTKVEKPLNQTKNKYSYA